MPTPCALHHISTCSTCVTLPCVQQFDPNFEAFKIIDPHGTGYVDAQTLRRLLQQMPGIDYVSMFFVRSRLGACFTPAYRQQVCSRLAIVRGARCLQCHAVSDVARPVKLTKRVPSQHIRLGTQPHLRAELPINTPNCCDGTPTHTTPPHGVSQVHVLTSFKLPHVLLHTTTCSWMMQTWT